MTHPATEPHEDNRPDIVQIQMDGKHFPILRGHRTVTEIKAACHVKPTFVIERVNDEGQPTLLDDGASVNIKGGERFISHVRGGGSS